MRSRLSLLFALILCFAGINLVAQESALLTKLKDLEAQVKALSTDPALPGVVKLPITTAAEQLGVAILNFPPPVGTGICGELRNQWHSPVVNGNCFTKHEHGDAPPDWVTAWSMTEFGHGVIYGGDETSGSAENGMKHEAFKGYTLATVAGGQVYVRYHAASNPLDRMAQVHSIEIYVRDTQQGISFWQGLTQTGNPETDRIPRRRGVETQKRPVILVVDKQSLADGIGTEQWYMFTHRSNPQNGTWGWDLGLNISGASTLYTPGENATAMDQATWVPNGNQLGLTRLLEGVWIPGRGGNRVGKFYATGHGVIVDEMAEGALMQYIAPTLAADARLEFGVRRISFRQVNKQFPGQGVTRPN